MIYVLKIIWDYRVPLLELIVRNIAHYPQSATSTPIRYQPAIRYLVQGWQLPLPPCTITPSNGQRKCWSETPIPSHSLVKKKLQVDTWNGT
jgi:hypothetical protein